MSAMKTAMLNKDEATLRGLRAIKSALLLEKTSGAGTDISEETEIKILQKLVKQRKESLDIYTSQNRADLAEKESQEIAVIEQFLPAQLSDAELTTIIQKIIADTGASSMKDMGKVMGLASAQLAGRADSGAVSKIVKQCLSAS